MSTMPNTCTSVVPVDMSAATLHASVRAHPATDAALEHWLKTEVSAIYDDLEAHPDSAIPLADVEENIYCSVSFL